MRGNKDPDFRRCSTLRTWKSCAAPSDQHICPNRLGDQINRIFEIQWQQPLVPVAVSSYEMHHVQLHCTRLTTWIDHVFDFERDAPTIDDLIATVTTAELACSSIRFRVDIIRRLSAQRFRRRTVSLCTHDHDQLVLELGSAKTPRDKIVLSSVESAFKMGI